MTSAGSSSGMNLEGSSSVQQHRSAESIAEWRSSEQVENGTPSTSPPYWDSDEEDDGGLKPSELYGKYTWKIDKFSEINKRELRSDAFDIGGYEWYILIYPQGCDVCNHLSLFLCVANHDKLSPGWSHFAQFTIAVVNKEPKKSKYSDTLHRFWKKEHDWGWKKFIEISKLWDGFVEDDTLIIKAQVQVLRERADRPFRCLDILYRRELLRIYLGNVVQICRNFVEEKRGKLVQLIEDKARWSSFRSFWLTMDQDAKDFLSREKAEAILTVVVKQFFVEKEVSSTLVMDSLYSGLRALKGHAKEKKGKSRYVEEEDYPFPMILMEDDSFVLIDDVLPLLEMAAMEALPAKDEKGPQTRTNKDEDVAIGEDLSKDTIERDERRLTELGRRTIEIFILTHIFSKIDITHQEVVALRRQEELIQEEAALLAGNEQKGKRAATDKEKKSKKKQDKQKRNNRKAKEKGKDDKSRKNEQPIISPSEGEEILALESGIAVEKSDKVENISDANDSLECVPEVGRTDAKDADAEIAQPDSSSDSFSEVVRRKSQNGKNRKSASRGKNNQRNVVSDSADWYTVGTRRASKAVPDVSNQFETSRRFQVVESLSQAAVSLSRDTVAEKEEKPAVSSRELINVEVCTNPATCVTSPLKTGSKSRAGNEMSMVKRSSKDSLKRADRSPCPANSGQDSVKLAQGTQKLTSPEPIEKSADNRVQIASEMPPMQHVVAKTDKPSTFAMPTISRPLSAPITSGPRPNASSVSMVQSTPVLARCVRDAAAAQSYVPQSYRNAVFGGPITQSQPTSSMANSSLSYAQATCLAGSPIKVPHSSDRIDTDPIMPSFSFGMVNVNRHHMQNRPLWSETMQRDNNNNTRNLTADHASTLTGMHSFEPHNPLVMRSQHNHPSDFSSGPSDHQGHVVTEDFPHIDIINELFDDEHGIGSLSMSDFGSSRSFSDGLRPMDRQFSFPGEVSSGPGPSASPAGFSRTRSYHDTNGLQHGYGASIKVFDVIPQFTPPRQPRNGLNSSGYSVNQWQLSSSELLPYQMNEDNNGYTTAFRPSSNGP